MKKIKQGKLALATETLAPLTGDALDLVAGGAQTLGSNITGCSIYVGCGGGGGVVSRLVCPPDGKQ